MFGGEDHEVFIDCMLDVDSGIPFRERPAKRVSDDGESRSKSNREIPKVQLRRIESPEGASARSPASCNEAKGYCSSEERSENARAVPEQDRRTNCQQNVRMRHGSLITAANRTFCGSPRIKRLPSNQFDGAGACGRAEYHFCCNAFNFSFTAGGNFGNKNAICNRMPHGEPPDGCAALP